MCGSVALPVGIADSVSRARQAESGLHEAGGMGISTYPSVFPCERVDAVRMEATDCGAIEVLADVMYRYHTNTLVITASCEALRCICTGNGACCCLGE